MDIALLICPDCGHGEFEYRNNTTGELLGGLIVSAWNPEDKAASAFVETLLSQPSEWETRPGERRDFRMWGMPLPLRLFAYARGKLAVGSPITKESYLTDTHPKFVDALGLEPSPTIGEFASGYICGMPPSLTVPWDTEEQLVSLEEEARAALATWAKGLAATITFVAPEELARRLARMSGQFA
jgi:hypothetical protein